MDDMELDLTQVSHYKLRASGVRHRTDEEWSSFDFGDHGIRVSRTDLAKIRAARELAQKLSAEAAMWDSDLAACEAVLVAAGAGDDTQTPATDSAPAPDEPFGGHDPELDRQVAKVTSLPETRRKSKTTPEDAA
ncbi:hypothetical protein [Streptomyces albidoflavus]|uniref:hypothetical protein n=1 Tax=Streptomyces albidoflavus TaxID=1886 RepID=UPI00333209DA